MRILCRALPAVLLSVVLLSVGAVCFASSPIPTQPFEVTLEPQGPLVKGGEITMSLSYRLLPKYSLGGSDTGSYTVRFINLWDRTDTISQITYPVRYDSTHSYSTTFQTILPNADTSLLSIVVTCGVMGGFADGYFINEGGEIKFYHYLPPQEHKKSQGNSGRRNSDPIRDTLTQEQLSIKYDVVLILEKTSSRNIAEKLLGSLPDSCLYNRAHQCYRMNVSLGLLIKLADQGVTFIFATLPPWDSRYNDSTATINPELPKKDTIGIEGMVPQKSGKISPAGISLDHVDGLASEGILPTGVPITFYLRVNNPTGINYEGITNGFRIYSDDGAEWNNLTADTLNLGWEDMFDSYFGINYYHIDGWASERIFLSTASSSIHLQ